MDAAGRAEPVNDRVLVEGVAAHDFVRREQAQRVARHGPQKGALARADRAVAGDGRFDFAFDLESDLAAVTASPVEHSFLLRLSAAYRRLMRMTAARLSSASWNATLPRPSWRPSWRPS